MSNLRTNNPGRMDRRIKLYALEETRERGGGVVKSWLHVASRWATWTALTGREIQQAEGKLSLLSGIFRIRWYQFITSRWRVVFGDQHYEIVSPPIEVGRKEFLDLVVTSTADSAPNQILDDVRLMHDLSSRRLHDGSFVLLHSND